MMMAASNGPTANPPLPPTWKMDCARLFLPPDAICATLDSCGMKHGRAQTDNAHSQENQKIILGESQQEQAHQGEAHARWRGHRDGDACQHKAP